MSWLSNLANRAEAMLNKIDQEAAVALQQQEGSLLGSNLVDHAFKSLADTLINPNTRPSDEEELLTGTNENNQNNLTSLNYENDYDRKSRQASSLLLNNDATDLVQMVQTPDNSHSNPTSRKHIRGESTDSNGNTDMQQSLFNSELSSDSTICEITGQASSSVNSNFQDTQIHKPPAFIQAHHHPNLHQTLPINSPQLSTSPEPVYVGTSSNHYSKTMKNPNNSTHKMFDRKSKNDSPPVVPVRPMEVDEIRAAINKSLEEYATKAQQQQNERPQRKFEQSSTSDRPSNTNYSQSKFANSRGYLQDQLNRSLKPTTNESDSSSVDMDLLKGSQTSFLNNGSNVSNITNDSSATFYLPLSSTQKKLSYDNNYLLSRLKPYIKDKLLNNRNLNLRLRRAYMRLNTFLRRTNYFFRAYPMMKYVILFYVFIMHLLIIYVLFFYQSQATKDPFSDKSDIGFKHTDSDNYPNIASEPDPSGGTRLTL